MVYLRYAVAIMTGAVSIGHAAGGILFFGGTERFISSYVVVSGRQKSTAINPSYK
jgi:hypothetical protein